MLRFLSISMDIVGLIVVGILLATLFGAVYHLFQQNGRLLLRMESLERQLREHGLPIADGANPLPVGVPSGTRLNDFSLPTLSGETARLSQWLGSPLLLIFVHPECSFCGALLQSLGEQQRSGMKVAVAPVFVSRGSVEANRLLFGRYELTFPVLLQEEAEVSSLFQIPGTPSAYLLDSNLMTAADILTGAEPILKALRGGQQKAGKFTRSIGESKLVRDGLKPGTKAPDFSLPAVDGSEVSLTQYRGRSVLLVFSDPACGPCQALAPELERLHQARNGFEVLMVSRGAPDINRQKAEEQHLTFRVALQRHWEVSKAFGIFATPVAYLIDESGVIMSDVAVGAEPILEMARAAQPRLA